MKRIEKFVISVSLVGLFGGLGYFGQEVKTLKQDNKALQQQLRQVTNQNDELKSEVNNYKEVVNSYKDDLDSYVEQVNDLNNVVANLKKWTFNTIVLGACSPNSKKTFMDYRTITNSASKQYDLIYNHMTVGSDGLLRDNDGFIGVALGSYYGEVGDRFIIELNGEREVKVIKIDEKSNDHTINGCYQKWDGSVMEIVVDTNLIGASYYEAKTMGDFDYSDLFNGQITNTRQVVE